MIGDENDIRFFLPSISMKPMATSNWPFTDSKKDIEEFVAFFLKMTGFPANYANLLQLETQIAVNLHRFKIGATIQTTSDSTK